MNLPPDKRFYGAFGDPYKYVTRSGAFGVDIDKMRKEDPERFEKTYIEPARRFREYYEARGHTFKNGKIDPPIVIRD